ncbi:hypothetical protein WDV06_17645 [Streptomyces racemochromogenes]|uniref:Uncharacterized protein n=1 Tax=Streptomyces racemochromogenes TaxID=67353 RepID=A0ABW7PET6_9ACTN
MAWLLAHDKIGVRVDGPVRVRLTLAWPGLAWPGLAWPARLRGASERWAGGVVQQGRTHTALGEKCVCRRLDCGGVEPVAWCPDHGDEVSPLMDSHPGGGLRCVALAARWTKRAARG